MESIAVPTETMAPEGTTNAYLVESALVDPAGRTDALDRAVAQRDVDHVLVTHVHPDHVGGVAHYADVCDATVWARAGRERRFVDATGVEPDRTFRGGTRVGPLTAVDTPGHAPDHVAFEYGEALLTGDLVVAEGSVVVAGRRTDGEGAAHPATGEGDVRSYLVSLRRLHARDPATLHPGHGPVIDDPRAQIRRLIDHRLAREERVADAVRSGARTLADVTDAAYDKDVSSVRSLAEATVAAHLEKLDAESAVAWDGRRAEPRS
ncbi:MBL fold metallo-hydrolase [Halomicrococcus gelatinilyticus]|uniref:MBL fold metallo-hydrolase n=1 Tax=Halomicrococcus gelatinilyticus TaxID=1702103 RepID=UPI002E1649A0